MSDLERHALGAVHVRRQTVPGGGATMGECSVDNEADDQGERRATRLRARLMNLSTSLRSRSFTTG